MRNLIKISRSKIKLTINYTLKHALLYITSERI